MRPGGAGVSEFRSACDDAEAQDHGQYVDDAL